MATRTRVFSPKRLCIQQSARPSTVDSYAPLGTLDPPTYHLGRKMGVEEARKGKYNTKALIEQTVTFRDIDRFLHANNKFIFGLFEDSRLAIALALHGEIDDDLFKSLQDPSLGNTRIGMILASTSAKYFRPVLQRDHIMCASRVADVQPSRFVLEHWCWSYQQRAVVAMGDSHLVTYDYKALQKVDMPISLKKALEEQLVKVPR